MPLATAFPNELVGIWSDLFTYLLGYFTESFTSDVSLLPSERIDDFLGMLAE